MNDISICRIAVKWTPVNEELPTEEGCYLVTLDDLDTGRYVNTRIFTKGRFRTTFASVVAWAPLPEPYGGE